MICPVCKQEAQKLWDNDKGCEHCTRVATYEEVTALLYSAQTALQRTRALLLKMRMLHSKLFSKQLNCCTRVPITAGGKTEMTCAPDCPAVSLDGSLALALIEVEMALDAQRASKGTSTLISDNDRLRQLIVRVYAILTGGGWHVVSDAVDRLRRVVDTCKVGDRTIFEVNMDKVRENT